MKEVEILYYLKGSLKKAKRKLSDFKFKGEYKVVDIYYQVPEKTCLRIRKNSIGSFLTHKNDIFEDGKWLYSEEQEVKVDDFDKTKALLSNLFKERAEIRMDKIMFENEKYNIVLEKVENTGNFLEIELKKCQTDIKIAKQGIREFVNTLGLEVEEVINKGGKLEIVEDKKQRKKEKE